MGWHSKDNRGGTCTRVGQVEVCGMGCGVWGVRGIVVCAEKEHETWCMCAWGKSKGVRGQKHARGACARVGQAECV